MSDRPAEFGAILSDVRRQWTLRARLRAWTLGAGAAAAVILSGLAATSLVAGQGGAILVTSALATVLSLFVTCWASWSYRRPPTDGQTARFIEERIPSLDDVLVTAVEYDRRSDASPAMRRVLQADAARALDAVDLDVVVPRASVREAFWRAAGATSVLAVAMALFAPAFSRATLVASAYLFPARIAVDVTPGSTKVQAGQPVTIAARVHGPTGDALVPTLNVVIGEAKRAVPMTSAGDAATFAITIDNVTASFQYTVSAASTRSETFTVTVVRPPTVERIDLHYEFPKALGLEPRADEDSGDIYGPAGTRVRVTITADKPLKSGAMVLSDGSRLPLTGDSAVVEGGLTIEDDGSYRVALADHDGLENPGDTEYFIRTLDDRPPDVRIMRPATDQQVTALEEVLIEARADDDYGIASFDLVFQTPGQKERVVPLRGARGGLTATGLHTLFMEDLRVQPGDFVTYYARARDVNRSRRSTEARSDIFFLEVKPFEEEFVAAQSQSMGQGMQGGGGLQGLAEAQKEIIVATWKLDARARRARDAAAQQDIRTVAKAQADLRARAEQATAQMSRTGDPRRRRGLQGLVPGDNPLGRAVEAMGRAVNELDRVSTTQALPHEMDALNHLLRADTENRRRQVTRQQQAGGGGGANRADADLSTLFDQELRRRQQTNYETPNSTEERQENDPDDLLERIRELARRQDALNRQQRELTRNRARLDADELKRQLERLTREQNDLRQQAEQLAVRVQQQQRAGRQPQNSETGGQSSGESGSQGQQDSRRLREISEDMRNAATGMRRQDAEHASSSGDRAAERLRALERQMQAARPDDRRRALGDLQLETRQLADAERRLANETARTAPGQPGDDARRRLAGEQERLAERADRLGEQVKRMSRTGQGQPDERNATEDAAREFDRQKLGERMRQSAESLRQAGARDPAQAAADAPRQAARQAEDVARSLDRIADRLGAAGGATNADARRLSDQLSKSQELRDQLAELERSIEDLRREGGQNAERPDDRTNAQARPQGNGQDEPAVRQGPQQAQGQQGQAQGQNGQPSAQGRDGAGVQQGGTSGGNGGRVQQLQGDVNQRMRDAERLAEEIWRENPGMQGPNSETWWRSVSAPGTEAFKQDFARWESLKKNLLVALEDVETKVSSELRAKENQERLNAGGHDAVSEAYRELVDKYYRSLARKR